ncbi:hypothetical protein F5Y10DRAFT_40130 [Nemania abortiva]|nr:hypothetical protein F5Y10DRAFT_40130 [Nemania abortiva]
MSKIGPGERKGSASSSSSKQQINTPTHTTTFDTDSATSQASSSTFTMNAAVASAPEPGETYMIRECSSERALTLVDGKPTLLLNEGTRGGWHWNCEERQYVPWSLLFPLSICLRAINCFNRHVWLLLLLQTPETPSKLYHKWTLLTPVL